MIVKIKSRKRPAFTNVINYIFHDKDRLFDKDKRSFVITHNLKGNTVAAWEKQFKENELFRLRKRSDSVYLTHEIISFHRNDAKNISVAKLEEMAREYINKRNPRF